MASLVEVKILDYVLLLSCEESATVAEITASAVAEVQTFNLRNFPRKVLHTKDSTGRILSGSLRPLLSKLEPKLEVVIATYNSNDTLGPQETLSLFRDWQFWTASQVQEAVKALSIQDIPSTPDSNTSVLLYELCKAPVENVQLMCTKTLQLLLTKFPQRDLVIQAAEQISKLFATTSFATVAVAALECFKGLSPLQAKVFNGAKYVREMYNVQSTLARFPEDKQSMLFEAFRAISTIVGDRELLRVLGPMPNAGAPKSQAEVVNTKAVSFMDAVLNQASAASGNNDETTAPPLPAPAPAPAPMPAVGPANKRINLKRLESLLCSEDQRVRQYALQKLLKLLTLSSRAHIAERAGAEGDRDEATGGVNGTGLQNTAAWAITAMWDSRDSSVQDCSWDDELPQSRPESAYQFAFSDGKEVESLVKCLLRCLKTCIHARPPKVGRVSSGAGGGGVGDGARDENDAPEHSASPGRPGNKPAFNAVAAVERTKNTAQTVTATSTPGRLIQTALASPLTDEAAVLLIVDCLWQVVFFAQDVVQDARFPLGLHGRSQRLILTGAVLSNVQLVFANAAREWYRLLLTLAHADEGNKLLRYADLAEKCAFFFVLVVLHGMEGGWREAGLALEGPAVCSFLSASQPTYRSYLALTFLVELATHAEADNGGQSDARRRALPHVGVPQLRQDSSAPDSQTLLDLLSYRNFEAATALWRWGTAPDRARRSALMALTSLASCSAFGSFAAFMTKLDPITK
jgi:hypothetical protein